MSTIPYAAVQAALPFLTAREAMELECTCSAFRQAAREHHARRADEYAAAKRREHRLTLLRPLLCGLAEGLSTSLLRRFATLALLPALGPADEALEVAAQLRREWEDMKAARNPDEPPPAAQPLHELDVLCTGLHVHASVRALVRLQHASRTQPDGPYAPALEDGFIALSQAVRPHAATAPHLVKAQLQRLAGEARRRLAKPLGTTDPATGALRVPSRAEVCRAVADGTLPVAAALKAVSTALYKGNDTNRGLGLCGATVENYGHLLNTAIDEALFHSADGLPITLCAIYVAVGARAGVPGLRLVVPQGGGHILAALSPQLAQVDVAQWLSGGGGGGSGAGPSAQAPSPPPPPQVAPTVEPAFIDCFTHQRGALPRVATPATVEAWGMGAPWTIVVTRLDFILYRASNNALRALVESYHRHFAGVGDGVRPYTRDSSDNQSDFDFVAGALALQHAALLPPRPGDAVPQHAVATSLPTLSGVASDELMMLGGFAHSALLPCWAAAAHAPDPAQHMTVVWTEEAHGSAAAAAAGSGAGSGAASSSAAGAAQLPPPATAPPALLPTALAPPLSLQLRLIRSVAFGLEQEDPQQQQQAGAAAPLSRAALGALWVLAQEGVCGASKALAAGAPFVLLPPGVDGAAAQAPPGGVWRRVGALLRQPGSPAAAAADAAALDAVRTCSARATVARVLGLAT